MISGAYTLLITPFDERLQLDEEGLRLLVRRQVESGIHGIAPLGVTGENPALNEEEIKRVVEIVVEEANGKCRVAPDTCTNNLEETIRRSNLYADFGCDYSVVYAPFLVKPNQEGLINFYEKVASKSRIPLIIHNSPKRVGVNLEPESYARLASNPNIIGTKEGSMQIGHLAKLIELTKGDEFSVFTAKDTPAYPLMCFGGKGVFTVAGNLIPKQMADLVNYCLNGKKELAEQIHHSYYRLFEALRFETNPMATKEALNLMGLPAGKLRLPLTRLKEKNRKVLESVLRGCRLI
jgi:4-hydroxy-tetrahydrodipicolinate synthase